ncbi:MAG: hypothetical protein HC892_21160 [Saprospiraceae bacterium]|nr:hypothetical protein [Saprospiraceae bacterium]
MNRNRLLNSTEYFEFPVYPNLGETKWMIQDQHQLWIGVNQWQTWTDGKADQTDNRFEGIFTFDTQQEQFLPTPFQTHHQFFSVPFYSVGMIDHKKRFWIANHYEGIRVLDMTTHRTLHLWQPETHDTLMKNSNWVMDILEDSRKKVWIATYQGMFYFDESKQIFQKIPDAKDKNGKTPSNAFMKIAEDLKGNIWVVGWHILWKLDKDGNQLGVWTEMDGIYDVEIRNIAVDAWNRIWIGTFDGLHLFDENTNTFKRFTVNDGLISNNTLSGFCLADKKNLLVGHIGGWNVVTINALSAAKEDATIAISNIKVGNQDFYADWNKSFVLKPKQNAISFDFSALNFKKLTIPNTATFWKA